MREIYRQSSNGLDGMNVLFVAKSSIMRDSYSKVLKTCEKTISRVAKEGRKQPVSE